MSVAAKDVMSLRQKTGLGMMDCKEALIATDGDMTAAEEWIRQKRKGKMDTRTERATGEGRIGVLIDGNRAAMIEIKTETDFTAKNEDFVAMVDAISKLAIEAPAGDIAVTDDMQKLVDDIRIKTGENAQYSRGQKLEGGCYGNYVHHDGKRACLLQVDGEADADTLKGICQHIVFHDPAAIGPDDVSAETLDKIRSQALAEAKDTGKNDDIAGKMAEGKVRKFLEENTLIKQKYVLDETKTVEEMLPSGVNITKFIRYTLGE
ncbi:MAG: translation elongation factor Ts [Phycisphaerales bacterium]|nr:translation elongation factor Ts [Phycisphaerales bacterium]